MQEVDSEPLDQPEPFFFFGAVVLFYLIQRVGDELVLSLCTLGH